MRECYTGIWPDTRTESRRSAAHITAKLLASQRHPVQTGRTGRRIQKHVTYYYVVCTQDTRSGGMEIDTMCVGVVVVTQPFVSSIPNKLSRLSVPSRHGASHSQMAPGVVSRSWSDVAGTLAP